MSPAAVVPLADLTPYLLQQAALRASLLQTSFGSAVGDWDDLRQDLALDCLRRLPKFDASRGDWKGFVRGVVRNHACVLAARQIRRPEVRPLDTGADCGRPLEAAAGETDDLPSKDFWPVLELTLDTQRVLADLPHELQTLARSLAHMPISAICRRTGLSRFRVERKLRRIRAAFEAAGIFSTGLSSGRKGTRRRTLTLNEIDSLRSNQWK